MPMYLTFVTITFSGDEVSYLIHFTIENVGLLLYTDSILTVM